MNSRQAHIFGALIASMALGAALAGPAHAAILDGDTGNGELVFSVYDDIAKISYAYDLGIRFDAFDAVAMSMPGASRNWNVASDPNWTAFMQSGIDPARLKWMVGALDNTGTGAGGQRYLSTSAAPLSLVATQTNSALSYFRMANDYLVASNALGTHAVLENGSDWTAGPRNYAWFGDGFGERWRNRAVFSNSASPGQAMGFYFLTPSSTYGLDHASVVQYGNAYGSATWSFSASGDLVYAAPATYWPTAPVPEPGMTMLFAAGLMLLALRARRRNG